LRPWRLCGAGFFTAEAQSTQRICSTPNFFTVPIASYHLPFITKMIMLAVNNIHSKP